MKIFGVSTHFLGCRAVLFTEVSLVGLFLVYVNLMGTLRCGGGSGTCSENMLADRADNNSVNRNVSLNTEF